MSQLRIIHIEDEIRKHKGLWNYVRLALLKSITPEERLLVETEIITPMSGETYVFSMSWKVRGKHGSIEIATFSNADLAKEYLSHCKKGYQLCIVDILNQASGKTVLKDNIKLVKKYISDVSADFRIFSSYCDEEVAKIRRNQDVASNDSVFVPREWGMAKSEGVLLEDIMLSKTQAPELSNFILNWIRNKEILDIKEV